MAETEDAAFDSEAAVTFRHRLHAFERLGFPEDEAVELAGSAADWHQVERMLTAGCSREAILRIVL